MQAGPTYHGVFAVSIPRPSEQRLLGHVTMQSAKRRGLETVKHYVGHPEYYHFLLYEYRWSTERYLRFRGMCSRNLGGTRPLLP